MHRNDTTPSSRWTDGLSDLSIAGDPMAFPGPAVDNTPARPTTVADFAALARDHAADRARWEPLVRFDALTRWYARLEIGAGYEVWLLSWLPGQSTGLHDHGRSSSVLTVVQGELTERSLSRSGDRTRTLRPGRLRVVPGSGRPGHGVALPTVGEHRRPSPARYLHEMVNTSLEPAVSIHVYAPGLVEMNRYRDTSTVAAPRQQGAYQGA